MSEIRKQSDVSEIAAIVSAALEKAGITAVLSGGAAVSIYTKNAYVSLGLDFVSSESSDRIEPVLAELGFKRGQGRFFTHEDTVYVVEFPSGPVSFGGDVVREWGRIETAAGAIQIITPTQCVMDRLAAFYHWSDPQALDQAIAVARAHDVDLQAIDTWSEREGFAEEFGRFLRVLRTP